MTNKPPEKVIKSLAAISKSSKLMRLKLIYACALDSTIITMQVSCFGCLVLLWLLVLLPG